MSKEHSHATHEEKQKCWANFGRCWQNPQIRKPIKDYSNRPPSKPDMDSRSLI